MISVSLSFNNFFLFFFFCGIKPNNLFFVIVKFCFLSFDLRILNSEIFLVIIGSGVNDLGLLVV